MPAEVVKGQTRLGEGVVLRAHAVAGEAEVRGCPGKAGGALGEHTDGDQRAWTQFGLSLDALEKSPDHQVWAAHCTPAGWTHLVGLQGGSV